MSFKTLSQVALCLLGGLFATAQAADVQEQVTRATLDNGLRVVIVRSALAPVVTTEINYLAGSDEAPAGLPGTAHAMEHMMFRGSPGLSKDQLAAIAANMGGAFNAETTQSVTRYYFIAPSEDLDVALRIEALRMRALDAGDEQWNKERGAIEQEVSRDLSSPDFKFFTQMMQQMFSGTPYEHTPLGTRPTFDRTTAAVLKRFHDTWYAPNNAILVIAGAVDPEATLAMVKSHFGDIPRRALPKRPSFHFQPVMARTINLPTDNPYGSIYLAYRMPGLRDPDHAAAQVLASALGSKRADLHAMGLDGTALFGGFGDMPLPESGVGFAVGIVARGNDPKPVLARMQAILAQAATKGVDPQLVEAAKRNAIAGLEFRKNSVAGIANAWSDALAVRGIASPDAERAAIEAVTVADVNRVARTVFDPRHAMTAILTPESSGRPVESKGFGGAESFAEAPDKPVALPAWATAAFARLQVPPSMLHPTSFTLANGLKLVVQPETVSDTVELVGSVKTNSDLQTPAGQDGANEVLGTLFQYGTTHMDRLQFQQALDGISAQVSAGSQFSLSVPAAHFAEGLALLADNELHPALPEKAFKVMQQQQAGLWSGVLQSPDFLDELATQKALLPADDPQLRHPTVESLGALTYAQVRDYYSRTFRPDLTTIVIVGKIEPEAARALVEKTFADWHAEGPTPDVDYSAVPPNAPGQIQTPDASAVQDTVRMSQMIDVNRTDPDRFALELGNKILGGGFYASWLYRDLRDKTGLVYNVGSNFSLDRRRSTYVVDFGADPDKVKSAHDRVLKDLQLLQSKPVDDNDLLRAKGLLLRELPLGESSFHAIAHQLLDLEQMGLPLNETTVAGEHYLALNAEQVRDAYSKHIRIDGFVTSIKGPAPK